MATISVSLILSSGVETLTLELYNAGTLLNTGGDALVEVGTSGYFEADVAETIVADLDAVIKQDGVPIAGGTLYLGQSQVGRVAGSDATLAKQDEILAAVGAIEPALTGPFTRTITVTDSVSGDPIEGVSVRLSLAADTESQLTNTSGVASFTVSTGTWSYEVFRSGYAGASGTVVVSESGGTAVSLVANATVVLPLISSSGTLIRRPGVNRRGSFMTLASVVDHLLSVEEINPGETRSIERAVTAAQSSLLSLTSYSTQGFRYYQGRSKLVMPGTLALGTVTVASGLVTVTVGLPDWLDLAHLRIGKHSYSVVAQSGASAFYVDSTLADGTYTTATLEQVFFQLPKNFRRRGRISDRANQLDIEDLSGSALQSLYDHLNWINNSGRNRSFSAITVDQRYQGELMLMVWPPYPARTELDLFYERYPEPLDVHRTAITALGVSGNVATAGSAVFTDNHVGCAITIGTTDNIEITKPLASQSLVEAQRVILRVNSPTEVVIDANVSDQAIENRASYVSDIVDVLKGPMSEAYLRLAEYELLRQARHKSAQLRQKEFIEQLAIAMQDDNRNRESPGDMSRNDGHIMWGDTTYT